MLSDPGGGGLQLAGIHVAERHNPALAGSHGAGEDVVTPPPGAIQRGSVFALLAEERGGKRNAGLKEGSTVRGHQGKLYQGMGDRAPSPAPWSFAS
jgi:hypothetical protein